LPSKKEFQAVYGKALVADDKQIISVQPPAALLYDGSIKEVMMRNYQKIQALLSSLPA